MPTYRIEAVLYVDADDACDARQIAHNLMVDFIRKVDVTKIAKIKDLRFERTLTVDQLDSMWGRPNLGEPPIGVR